MTELEELIPAARSPVKRLRNVVAESVSDALISDRPKRSRSRTSVPSQDSVESDGFLMQIDEIEKNYTGSQDKMHPFPQFGILSFSLGMSQEEKEVLPKGVLVVDSHPDSLAAAVQVMNCDMEDIVMECMTTSAQRINTPSLLGPILLCSQEDNDTFIDRSLMRITERNLHVPDVQTPTNTDKGKDVLVEVPKRHRTRTAQCYFPLQDGKTLSKTPTKSEKKQRREKPGETKKEKPKKNAFPVRLSQRVQYLSKPLVQQGHISKVEISSDTSDDEESSARKVESNDESSDRSSQKPQEQKEHLDKSPTRLQHIERDEKREEIKKHEPKNEPVTVRTSKGCFKDEKPTLKSEGKESIELQDAQLSTSDALPEEKASSSRQDIEMAPQQ
ncbi:hypothetical protein Cgig2_031617 [Carnegiea gigantea]|uniref:Uncharacterized protein n=1 Tax=Carnegiea gigantea TaxID=171969 RepID=A0A9Q1QAK3_9CARY|nr:hypothetical protein Cgig2_031617 [Carnegiea gigantea]